MELEMVNAKKINLLDELDLPQQRIQFELDS